MEQKPKHLLKTAMTLLLLMSSKANTANIDCSDFVRKSNTPDWVSYLFASQADKAKKQHCENELTQLLQMRKLDQTYSTESQLDVSFREQLSAGTNSSSNMEGETVSKYTETRDQNQQESPSIDTLNGYHSIQEND